MSSNSKPTVTTTAKYGTIPTTATLTTTPSTSTTTTAVTSPTSVSPYTTFITHATTQTRTLITHRPPWPEFFSLSSLSLPTSYSTATSRFRRNLNYFRYNYTLITLLILFLSLIYHPISMIIFLSIFLLWLFLYFSRDTPINIFGRNIDDRVILLGLSLVTILGLVFTHVGVNVLVSLVIGFVLMGLHASFREIDDLFLDEDDAVDGGLVSVVEGQPLRPTYARVV